MTRPDFRKQLHEHGFRATPERTRLLEVLWSAKRPLTVDEIGRKLDCNVVTVYRALTDLRGKGLVTRGIGTNAAHFSYAKKDHHHHHHLVCVDCGFSKQCATCA